MVRRAATAGTAPVYDISTRQVNPLSASLSVGARATALQKRAYRKQQLENTETQLIQNFAFPTLSNRVKVTPDGNYIFATGVYPPQVHIYDVHELSLKYKRHVTAEIVDIQILEQGYNKFALLTGDRGVELHTAFGKHFETRVPRFGRDFMLHKGSADLYVVGDGREAWRLNLHQGRFLAPLQTQSGAKGGNNVCGISPVNSLLYFGGEQAMVDVWDSRVVGGGGSGPAGSLDVYETLCDYDSGTRRLIGGVKPEITALRCDERDGVSFAVGTGNGFVGLFDLRKSGVVSVRDQGNGMKIRSIRLHERGRYVLSADANSIKVWERASEGGVMVGIEPDVSVNHLCMVGGSGVLCAAVEAPKVKTYYVPALGNAPKWCAFLDSFTEELEGGRRVRGGLGGEEEEDEEVYENYKFVGSEELEGLGLGHLVGTEMLKAYMHGYFVHQKLYRRAVEVSEPFAYEKYRKEKAREKMEKERESRIAKKKTKRVKVKVNQQVAEALQRGKGKKGKREAGLLKDERFKAMFENTDYAVDEEAERFQHLYPSGAPRREVVEEEDSDEEYLEQFDLVDDGEQHELDSKGAVDGMSSDESSDGSGEEASDQDASDETDEDGNNGLISRGRGSNRGDTAEKKRGTKMYALGDIAALSGERQLTRVRGIAVRKVRDEMPLAERLRVGREVDHQKTPISHGNKFRRTGHLSKRSRDHQ
eukprot:GFKZ01010605.1.p1 GENE.GFKZ01010605.1~~GFKZ01010605.1.p1  ORF type:complete len:704 (-),score=139.51 GFKZ01010605.1:270-2381(-)